MIRLAATALALAPSAMTRLDSLATHIGRGQFRGAAAVGVLLGSASRHGICVLGAFAAELGAGIDHAHSLQWHRNARLALQCTPIRPISSRRRSARGRKRPKAREEKMLVCLGRNHRRIRPTGGRDLVIDRRCVPPARRRLFASERAPDRGGLKNHTLPFRFHPYRIVVTLTTPRTHMPLFSPAQHTAQITSTQASTRPQHTPRDRVQSQR